MKRKNETGTAQEREDAAPVRQEAGPAGPERVPEPPWEMEADMTGGLVPL